MTAASGRRRRRWACTPWAYRASRSSRSLRRTKTPQAATRTRRRRRIPLPRLQGSERLPTRSVPPPYTGGALSLHGGFDFPTRENGICGALGERALPFWPRKARPSNDTKERDNKNDSEVHDGEGTGQSRQHPLLRGFRAGPWVKGVNYLSVQAVEMDPFKSLLPTVVVIYGRTTSALKKLNCALFSSVTGCQSSVPSSIVLPFSNNVAFCTFHSDFDGETMTESRSNVPSSFIENDVILRTSFLSLGFAPIM